MDYACVHRRAFPDFAQNVRVHALGQTSGPGRIVVLLTPLHFARGDFGADIYGDLHTETREPGLHRGIQRGCVRGLCKFFLEGEQPCPGVSDSGSIGSSRGRHVAGNHDRGFTRSDGVEVRAPGRALVRAFGIGGPYVHTGENQDAAEHCF